MAIVYTDDSGKRQVFRSDVYHRIYANGARKLRVYAPDGGLVYPDNGYKYWTKLRGYVNESWHVPSDCPLMFDSTDVSTVGELTVVLASFHPLVIEDVASSYIDMIPRINWRDSDLNGREFHDYTNIVTRLVFSASPQVQHKAVIEPWHNMDLYGRIEVTTPAVVSQFGTVKRVLGYSGYYRDYVSENSESALMDYDGNPCFPQKEAAGHAFGMRDHELYGWDGLGDVTAYNTPQRFAQMCCHDGIECLRMSSDASGPEFNSIAYMDEASRYGWYPRSKRHVSNGHEYGWEGLGPIEPELNTRMLLRGEDGEGSPASYVTFDACLVNMKREMLIDPDARHMHVTHNIDTVMAVPIVEVVDSNYDIDESSRIWRAEGAHDSVRMQSLLTSVYYEGIPDWGMDVIEESRLTYPTEPIIPL